MTNPKVDYVREQSKRGRPCHHTCHWPGCTAKVPPAKWGCKGHWFRLPANLRARIWRTYEPGQEVSKTPSQNYIIVAREVQAWIREHADRQPDLPL